MKKFPHYILPIVLCLLLAFSFTACDHDGDTVDDFIPDGEHCVVSLPQDYDISFDNFEASEIFDKALYNAQTVNGKPKKAGFRYYSVPKHETFRILTPLGIIQNKNQDGQTLVYWQLNDALYKDRDDYYSKNTFSCAQDTEIIPVYYEFRAVGMILLDISDNVMQPISDEELFDFNGKIKERDGLYYLYGVYDFEPDQEFWRTNMTIDKFEVQRKTQTVAGNYSKDFYTLNIEIDKSEFMDKDKIIVLKLYKIDGHGYMTYGTTQINYLDSSVTSYLSVGDHTLKYSFN